MIGFIHIPKTGGSYVGQTRTTRGFIVSPCHRNFSHIYIVHDKRICNPQYYWNMRRKDLWNYTMSKEKASGFKLFSGVRNPFSWLVSFADHAGGWTKKYRNTAHIDYSLAQNFKTFVKTISEREKPFPFKKFLFHQLWCSDGTLMVDWIFRQETLDDDLKDMATEWGLKYKKQDKQRVSDKKDYRTYYDTKTIDIVNKTWGRELELFGYDFEGLTGKELLGRGKIDKNIKYYFDKDKL